MEKEKLHNKLNLVLPHLNEKQQRLLLAAEAQSLGHGGITAVAKASGMSRPIIHRGIRELNGTDSMAESNRVRKPGGGRKKLLDKDLTLQADLDALVGPETRGDPESPLRWTCKSVRNLAKALQEKGHSICHQAVSNLLRQSGYSLQANAKKLEGSQHEDRDAQFGYINEQAKEFQAQKQPVVSVDGKKKELIGAFKNGGREWRPAGEPEEVNVYDFWSLGEGKGLPYGVYDIGSNAGWVSVGCDHDTAAFAVQTLRNWWKTMGSAVYPAADCLLVCADCGGSNGYRTRLWKLELQKFADETGLEVTVSHLPPGTSKWNKIEHRLFSFITMNWRSRPLISHEVMVQLIQGTTTREGLKVRAALDAASYPTKIKVSDDEFALINLHKHEFHGEWNYTISPRKRDVEL